MATSPEAESEPLSAVRGIAATQREMVALLTAQRSLLAEQVERSRNAVAESIVLQRLALRRQQTVTRIAVPGILACIAAIGWLVLRYF
ncbi:MAG: hypothetical protein AB7I68_12280 [Porticoccaceae bacterium]